eukprot:CAMPEP_0181109070 /NCGR_PEP_ID=MMETSP1071-20121207/17977_1 /TAXON_ID=35127 /ORGANISM="Thalassiosira sp., Strain NH16" /LENGTH=238 /DNA_ID=CAMNT_0023192735 /DNA_START=27 /DNA_END=740 /DNA_ORIENTATION=-
MKTQLPYFLATAVVCTAISASAQIDADNKKRLQPTGAASSLNRHPEDSRGGKDLHKLVETFSMAVVPDGYSTPGPMLKSGKSGKSGKDCKNLTIHYLVEYTGDFILPNGSTSDTDDCTETPIGTLQFLTGDNLDLDGNPSNITGTTYDKFIKVGEGIWIEDGNLQNIAGCEGLITFQGQYLGSTGEGTYLVTAGSGDFFGAKGRINEVYVGKGYGGRTLVLGEAAQKNTRLEFPRIPW